MRKYYKTDDEFKSKVQNKVIIKQWILHCDNTPTPVLPGKELMIDWYSRFTSN